MECPQYLQRIVGVVVGFGFWWSVIPPPLPPHIRFRRDPNKPSGLRVRVSGVGRWCSRGRVRGSGVGGRVVARSSGGGVVAWVRTLAHSLLY